MGDAEELINPEDVEFDESGGKSDNKNDSFDLN